MKRICILLSFVWSIGAYGQAVCPDMSQIDQTENPINVFDDLIIDKVLGDTECRTELCNAVSNWTNQDQILASTASAGDLLNSIRESAAALPNDQPGVIELKAILAEWQILMAEAEVENLPTATWQPARFTLFAGHPEEIKFEDIFLDRCPGSISQCAATFEVASCIYTHAVLQRRILVKLLEENRKATIAYLERLNLRWTAFNSGGRSLFPWELWANGKLHERKTTGRGFVEPPTKQFAFLHPSVAIAGQDAQGGDFEEVLVVELLGWYGWRWGGRTGATMKRPFGASVISAWDGSNEIGYGVMFHLPKNWSIGVTQKSINGRDETSVLVSVDLGKFLFREQELRNRIIDKISLAAQ